MNSEENYLKNKEKFELTNKNHDNFIMNFFSLFFQFNDFFKDNNDFKFEVKSISAQTLSGSITFFCHTKSVKNVSSNDYIYVNFEIKDKELYLSYTENNSQRSFCNMKQKSLLYIEVINFFENFNIDQFLNLCNKYEKSSKELTNIKREFKKLEKEYFSSLNLKYQKAFLTIINKVDEKKVLLDFEKYIETETDKINSKYQYNKYKKNKFEGFCFSFNLDKISFKEFSISIQKNQKTNKIEFILNYKKTSKKKCIETITNQFYYNNKFIHNFNEFKKINDFKESNFSSYSSLNSETYIKELVNPFMANIIAQNF